MVTGKEPIEILDETKTPRGIIGDDSAGSSLGPTLTASNLTAYGGGNR